MDKEWGGLIRDTQYNPMECPHVDYGSIFGAKRDDAMAKALQAFGGQIGARPTYADFYTHIDSVFQCIWAAQEAWEDLSQHGPLAGHLDDAEKALQALDDYIYEQLGKGDL